MRSLTDYILGIYCCLFRNGAVLDPRHNSEHYFFLGCLRIAPLRKHKVQAAPPQALDQSNERGKTLCVPAEGHPKA